MTDILTEVRFWAQVTGDAKRTVICPPDLESRVKGWVDSRGMAEIITVHASPICPPDRILVMDMGAIQADFNQSLLRYRPTSPRRLK